MNDAQIPDPPDDIAPDADRRLLQVRQSMFGDLNARENERHAFEVALRSVWGAALDLAELVLMETQDAHGFFMSVHAGLLMKERPQAATALAGIHWKAQRVMQEVLALLRSGLADGALARCRTLQELSVIGFLLASEDEELSERYLRHSVVARAKMARHYLVACGDDPDNPPSDADYVMLKAELEKALADYGREFRGDWGWACILVDSKRPTFVDLERKAEASTAFRPYFAIASCSIHAGSHGLGFSVGAEGDETPVGSGPSPMGLEAPGGVACRLMAQVTTALLMVAGDREGLVRAETLRRLTEQAGAAFELAAEEASALLAAHKAESGGVLPTDDDERVTAD